MSETVPSLKQRNAKAIWLLVSADVACIVIALFGFSFSLASLKEVAEASLLRAILLAAVGPIAATFLNDLIPAGIKASIVFGRLTDALPGHRAFSVHVRNDPRIDLALLKKRVGEFPDEPRAQNAAWYRLLQAHKSDPLIADAHGRFLLFRDCAALTLLILPIALVSLLLAGIPVRLGGVLIAALALQFLWLAVSARNAGIRLVQNVLALESTEQGKRR